MGCKRAAQCGHSARGPLHLRPRTECPHLGAPTSFNCSHSDLLYVFQELPGSPQKADYFDSEGHVIHYDVTAPTPISVVFLSVPGPGPQFRLSYELSGKVMRGKFQMHMPGQSDWRTYLEWSGSRN